MKTNHKVKDFDDFRLINEYKNNYPFENIFEIKLINDIQLLVLNILNKNQKIDILIYGFLKM